ncbi:TetR family transcriptional regulator [Streptomyces tateyamensis]|uniref:TetR family transcriptional regulator n=1 Tax=Streptomyces tateyamensis TaxID=565073 RepID=A0A2V4NR01_9ACTN|nr:TetR family transcriptional regulator C-terminal domain-containing protein [Streptomyces tateyamensis]PYC88312.1 TetR family transcriptional regulator [Streptomyces tateyamensis]
MRRVAEELTVRPGLISHYFPVAEELVAEAFGTAAGQELDELLPPGPGPGALLPAGPELDEPLPPRPELDEPLPVGPAPGALHRLARFFGMTGGPRYDDLSRLWLNARHLSRFRPVLAERVAHQEARWRERLTALLSDGVAEGSFRTADPGVAAIRILVVLDGLGAHASTDRSNRPPAVTDFAAHTAERELGLPQGALLAAARDGRTGGVHADGPEAGDPHPRDSRSRDPQ